MPEEPRIVARGLSVVILSAGSLHRNPSESRGLGSLFQLAAKLIAFPPGGIEIKGQVFHV
jgi:hypothetical protein